MSLARLQEHRRLWERKADLRSVYAVWFRHLLETVPADARVLEVGAGPGILAEAAASERPDLKWVSSDLLVAPWNRVCADASRLPVLTGSVDAVVGLDVLHHFAEPEAFFREAARVLGGKGTLRLVEPWITPLGWLVYRFFHQEDCRLRIDPWRAFPGSNKDSFDGNAAIPWRLVRDTPAREWRRLGFEPPRRRRLNAFAYLLTLGFREASLLPPWLVRPMVALDRWTTLFSPLVALRAVVTWESAGGAPLAVGDALPGIPGARTQTASEGEGSGPRGRRRGRALVLGGLLVAVALALLLVRPSGHGDAGARGRVQITRLLEDPIDRLDQGPLYEEEELRRVSFATPADAEGWVMGDGSALPGLGDGIVLPKGRARERVVGPLSNAPGEVAVVEVDVAQPVPSGVALFWPRTDGRFAADHAIARMPGPDGVARFVVASHRHWRRGITRVAVQSSFTAQPVRLRGIRLLSYGLSVARARTAPPGARAVELDGDTRPALAVVEGRRVTSAPVTVPAQARLRFALGLPEHVDAAGRFVLTVSGHSAADERLAEVEVGRGERGWHEHEVDLGRWAGHTVSFSVAIEPGGSAPIGFWGNPTLRWPAPADRRPNVLLISADTLRADHLSLYGYGRPTSPRLERWAERRAVVFRNTVASSPWTVPSHVSLFTGRDAHRHGVSRQGPIPRELPVLAERFRDAGYVTLATTGGGLVDARFGFGRGFDVFRTRDRSPRTDSRGELELGIEDTLRWLDRAAGERFFVFLHTYQTHTPLDAREPWFSRVRGRSGPGPAHPLDAEPVTPVESDGFQRRYRFVWTRPLPDGAAAPPGREDAEDEAVDLGDPQIGVDLYDAAIAHLDDGVGQLLDGLRERGLEQNTIVVFTSDHGESFGENGLWSHTHLLDGNLMVPLVIAPRPPSGSRVIDHQVRLVDAAPTILEMAGLALPPGMDGRSLLPLFSRARASHPEEAWAYSSRTNWGLGLRVANRWKLIVPNGIWPTVRGRDAFYDVSADPGETVNLAGGGEKEHALMRSALARELAAIDRGVVVTARCDRAPCFVAVLGGLGAERDTVTSPDLRCACVQPVPGGTRLSLAPGDAFTVVYEDLLDGELQVDVRSVGGPARKRRLTRRVGPGQGSFALRLERSGWRLDERGDVPPVGLQVGYRGSVAAPRPEISEEMRERLRAMGYLE